MHTKYFAWSVQSPITVISLTWLQRIILVKMKISEEEAESLSEGENESASCWQTLKERGRRAFERGDFAAAIARYKAALQHPNCPASEQQLLLSNMVAARLKIASPEHLKAAVENAKQVRGNLTKNTRVPFLSVPTSHVLFPTIFAYHGSA